MGNVRFKLNPTKDQLEEIKQLIGDKTKLYNSQGQPLPYGKLGKYLIDNFGDKIVDEITKQEEDVHN